jgi:hypothetical protein
MDISQQYILFFKFIETYRQTGFTEINPNDPLMIELEEMLGKNDQFFFIGDLLHMKILYCSKRSAQMIGIDQAKVTPYDIKIFTHPDDAFRLGQGTAKVFNLEKDLFINEKGNFLISTNLRLKKPEGGYSNTLFQCYLFYSSIPYKTVFTLQIHTRIDWCKKINCHFHYYVGNDMTYFRYPDEELLMIGHVFSNREFEIIRLIEKGLSSEQIAEKLFLSPHTVNTHRRNMLHKSGKTTMSGLIYDLMERGLL